MIGFCPLASGSKGNLLYFGSKKTKILIDAGLSMKATQLRLAEIGVDLSEIEAILITHDHSDHIKGLNSLINKTGIPIFCNSETAKGICDELGIKPKFKIFSTGESFEFGDLEIHPFSVQHDTVDPVGFTIKLDTIKVGICADLGFVTSLVKHQLKSCDYLYVEANHEPNMVHACSRPPIYKQRVLGRQGHLSNGDCAQLVLDVFHADLKHVYLAHLSSECNHPELALKIVREKLSKEGKELSISVAHQDKVSLFTSFEKAALMA
ncbi:MAG: MBL fold metallo-hydrolase [Rhabdochlamydiaceae bacterium]